MWSTITRLALAGYWGRRGASGLMADGSTARAAGADSAIMLESAIEPRLSAPVCLRNCRRVAKARRCWRGWGLASGCVMGRLPLGEGLVEVEQHVGHDRPGGEVADVDALGRGAERVGRHGRGQ